MPGGSVARAGAHAFKQFVDEVPALALLWERLAAVEEAALRGLADRLAQLDSLDVFGLAAGSPAAVRGDRVDMLPPDKAFAELLNRADDESPLDARTSAVRRILRELVPDEARIITALAGGDEYEVIQAHDGSKQIVTNHSSVGRAARVHSLEMTPQYVTHLLEFGLVELRPFEGRTSTEFELLEADTPVRTVLAPFDHRKLGKPRITRQLVGLSELGRQFCEICCLPE